MNVLNINQNHYIRGGSDTYYFSLSALLESKGHRVLPFAANHLQNIESPFSSYFPRPVNFDNPGMLDLARFIYSGSAAKSIERYIENERPSIAHMHIYYGQLSASILNPLKRHNIPIVQTLHEYKVVCPTSHLLNNGQICEACQGSNFWQATLKRCNRGSLRRSALSAVETYTSHKLGAISKVDHFLAVSHFLREKVISLGVPSEKVTTVHNFIDSSLYTPSYQVGSYFIYFGRLERMKGIFTLLRAMSELRDIKLLIIGDGNDKGEVERFIADEKLWNVSLLGFKRGAELHDLIRGSICTIAPSEWFETFGLTLIESFALGRPVICSRMGGMPEIVSEGLDGLIFPAGNVPALTAHIRWMSDNPKTAVEMGIRGRRKVEEVFSSINHYQQVMKIYDSVISHQ